MVPFIGDCSLFISDGAPYRRWQSLSYYFSKFNNHVISYHYVFELVYFSIGVVWYDRNHNISNVFYSLKICRHDDNGATDLMIMGIIALKRN